MGKLSNVMRHKACFGVSHLMSEKLTSLFADLRLKSYRRKISSSDGNIRVGGGVVKCEDPQDLKLL